ncbi:MAG TPA: tetratricopeptide repeat protein, partial [Gemmatimonadaceae bacterium]
VSCVAGHDKKKNDTVTSAKTPSTQSTLAGDVVPPIAVAQEPVTFASATNTYNKRQYRDATTAFDTYVQEHPNNAFGHYMLGLSAWKSGDLTRARSAFERSLELDSTNVKTLLNLGRVLLDQNQVDDAAVRIAEAVRIDSGSAETHRMMARVQAARGQRDSAMVSYRVAMSIDTADSWSMNNLGLLLIEQGRYEEALSPLARAVELRPEAPAFANNLGVALERTGHPKAAADAFRSALTADSTYKKATLSLARVEEKAKSDTTTIDVSALASSFNQELQDARKTRVMAKGGVKPDSVKPER